MTAIWEKPSAIRSEVQSFPAQTNRGGKRLPRSGILDQSNKSDSQGTLNSFWVYGHLTTVPGG